MKIIQVIKSITLGAVASGIISNSYAASIAIDNSSEHQVLIDRNTISKNGFRVDATIKIVRKTKSTKDGPTAGVALIDVEADCVSMDLVIETTSIYDEGNNSFSMSNPTRGDKEGYLQILENQKIKAKIIRNICRELY